ncbi:MAG: DUF6867 family protein, partial [Xanthobacteraceae bacterium]
MGTLYAGESILQVVLLSVVIGGGAAALSGRAIALAWRPSWQVVIVAILLAAAARFFHFALFEGELLSVPSYCCDTLIFIIAGMLAWRATRANQMVRQYPWLYVRSGPLGWREIG